MLRMWKAKVTNTATSHKTTQTPKSTHRGPPSHTLGSSYTVVCGEAKKQVSPRSFKARSGQTMDILGGINEFRTCMRHNGHMQKALNITSMLFRWRAIKCHITALPIKDTVWKFHNEGPVRSEMGPGERRAAVLFRVTARR